MGSWTREQVINNGVSNGSGSWDRRAAVANLGAPIVISGSSDAGQAKFNSTGVPEFSFDLFDSGFTRYSQFIEIHYLPGNHEGVGYSAHHIDVEAAGSTANLPTSNDIGLSIALRKTDYDSVSAETGELDALFVSVINGGPDAGATGTDRSASGVFTGAVKSYGQVGYSALLEGDVAQLNRGTSAIEHQVHVYAATLDVNTDDQTGYGFIADVLKGSLDAAFLARAPTSAEGTWDYLFQGMKDGSTVFSVTQDGVLTATNSITLRHTSGNRSINIGTGTPEGVVSGSAGALYVRTNATDGLGLYTKIGTGTTGWRPLMERHYGATAGRPSLSGIGLRGYSYFDTDIGKPVFWNGSGWVDATGASA